MMKKVLHISKFFYPYYGGIEDVVYTITQGLKNSNYEQQVICFSQNRHSSTEIIDEIPVTRVGVLGEIFSQPIPLCYRTQLKKVIASFKPDIIHIHLPNPLICACLLNIRTSGIKIVVHWHADILGKKLMYRLIRPVERKILDRADTIIATSREYAALSTPLQPYMNKVAILPNTINEHKFSIATDDTKEVERIRKKFGNKKIVLFIGRHVEYKGIRYLIESADQLPQDTIVLIAGSGQLTPKLLSQAQSHDNIYFLGRIPNEHIKFYMAAASVFAFPSIDRREAFGVALAEALYSGLPAVSFHIDGSGTNWVNQTNKTGFVVPNRDTETFAQAINTLLTDDALREQMSKEANLWVKNNFLSNQILRLIDIYGNLGV